MIPFLPERNGIWNHHSWKNREAAHKNIPDSDDQDLAEKRVPVHSNGWLCPHAVPLPFRMIQKRIAKIPERMAGGLHTGTKGLWCRYFSDDDPQWSNQVDTLYRRWSLPMNRKVCTPTPALVDQMNSDVREKVWRMEWNPSGTHQSRSDQDWKNEILPVQNRSARRKLEAVQEQDLPVLSSASDHILSLRLWCADTQDQWPLPLGNRKGDWCIPDCGRLLLRASLGRSRYDPWQVVRTRPTLLPFCGTLSGSHVPGLLAVQLHIPSGSAPPSDAGVLYPVRIR